MSHEPDPEAADQSDVQVAAAAIEPAEEGATVIQLIRSLQTGEITSEGLAMSGAKKKTWSFISRSL